MTLTLDLWLADDLDDAPAVPSFDSLLATVQAGARGGQIDENDDYMNSRAGTVVEIEELFIDEVCDNNGHWSTALHHWVYINWALPTAPFPPRYCFEDLLKKSYYSPLLMAAHWQLKGDKFSYLWRVN